MLNINAPGNRSLLPAGGLGSNENLRTYAYSCLCPTIFDSWSALASPNATRFPHSSDTAVTSRGCEFKSGMLENAKSGCMSDAYVKLDENQGTQSADLSIERLTIKKSLLVRTKLLER